MTGSSRRGELPDVARDFPLLSRTIEGRRVVYLDSAATALKPNAVIDAVTNFYRTQSANVHRGDHQLSQEASAAVEEVRYRVAHFINATSREIVFTAGTTDGLNLVADGLGLEAGDNVIATVFDHHSNLLPWMSRCEVRLVPERDDGTIDLDRLADMIDDRTRLVAVGHVSNVTGAIQPVAEVIAVAKKRGVLTAIDAAQSAPHIPLDVLELGCDFLAFSAHKMLGPSGIGVLYIGEEAEDRLQPKRLGGGTPDHVRLDGFTLKESPHRFEPGTPNIEGIIGLGAAIDYLRGIGLDRIGAHDRELAEELARLFGDRPGIRMLGPRDPAAKIAIASLVPTTAVTAKTVGRVLSDSFSIMARSGTHCAHPFFATHQVEASLRLSAYLYNTVEDLRLAADAIGQVVAGSFDP